MRKKIAPFFLYAVYLGLIILLIEITVTIFANYSGTIKFFSQSPYRLKNYDKITDLVSLHKSSNCSFKPGQIVEDFVVNLHGFLSPEIPYKKKADEYRIVFLGDSFSTFTPYKYNYIRLTEEQLNKDKPLSSNTEYQAINLGIPCVGPSVYLKQLEIEGILFQPNLVILGFFVGNDFNDGYNLPFVNKSGTPKKNILMELAYRSRFIALIINIYKTRFYSQQIKIASSNSSGQTLGVWNKKANINYDPHGLNLALATFVELETNRSTILIPQSDSYSELQEVKNSLIKIKTITKTNNIDLLVMIIPDEMQVNKKLLEEIAKNRSLELKDFDLNLPQKTIVKILKENQIKYVDLLPYFLAEDEPEMLYQPKNTHLNSIGNKKAAEILIKQIKQIILDRQ